MKSDNSSFTANLIIRIVLIVISLACLIIVLLSDTVKDGLEALFFLPLVFAIVCFLGGDVIKFAKDSFGLLLLYALIILRYLVSPVLIALSGTLVSSLNPTASGLRFAIVMMVVELPIVVIVIKRIWKPIESIKIIEESENGVVLTWAGAAVTIGLIAILVLRGNLPNIFAHLSFGFGFQYSSVQLKTYDMSAVLMIKTFLFLLIVSRAAKKYYRAQKRGSKTFFFAISILAAILNSMIFEVNNRATAVICAMSSLAVLLWCFGKRISKYIPVITLVGFVFVWSIFTFGNFGIGVKDASELFGRQQYLSDLSESAELYSNSVSTEAHSYDTYESISKKIDVDTILSELVKSNNLFVLPGFWVVNRLVENIPSIQNLFQQTLDGRIYILPNAGLALYLGGHVFSWLIDIIFHIIMIRGIYYFYRKRQRSTDVSGKYLFSYCEMILGLVFMNNLLIAVGLLTSVPMLLFVLFKINGIGRTFPILRCSGYSNDSKR